ncbi:MAG: FAD-binding protein [Pseudonocardiaceae bacterium]
MGSLSSRVPNLTFPQLPSAHGLGLVLRQLKQTEHCPQPTGRARMWHLLAGEVAQRGIPVRCRTPALDLLTDETGRVTGAVVQSEGSRQQARARRGVVLGRGGFVAQCRLALLPKSGRCPGGQRLLALLTGVLNSC